MVKCPKCGKNMGIKEKTRIKQMTKALTLSDKIAGKFGFMKKVPEMLKMIDDEAGVNLETLKKLSKLEWCLDCIIKESKRSD